MGRPMFAALAWELAWSARLTPESCAKDAALPHNRMMAADRTTAGKAEKNRIGTGIEVPPTRYGKDTPPRRSKFPHFDIPGFFRPFPDRYGTPTMHMRKHSSAAENYLLFL